MLLAVMFLTRIPVPPRAGRGDLARAVAWFPIVGAALGVSAVGFGYVAHGLIGLPSMLTAFILVAVGAWITGAVHLDGLADTVDGFGGGCSRDDVLRIMRDPHLGVFGALALMLAVSIKGAAVAAVIEPGGPMGALVAAPALARATAAPLGFWLPYARAEGGLGEAIAGRMTASTVGLTTVAAAAIAVAALGSAAIFAIAAATATTLAIGTLAGRRIGGVTGDVFGACIETTETLVLVTGVGIA